jgi:hypothetical protein
MTDEEYEKDVDKLLDRIADSSSRWMERRVQEAYRLESGISVDFRQAIKTRLVAYFGEAALVAEQRGYEPDTARSHACFVGLSNALPAFVRKGLDLRQDLEQFIQECMGACDSMSSEIRELMREWSEGHLKRGSGEGD